MLEQAGTRRAAQRFAVVLEAIYHSEHMALVPGNKIRQKKEQLKAQGYSGKKCDQDPEAPRHA